MLIQQLTRAMLLLFCGEEAEKKTWQRALQLVSCVHLEVLPVLYK